MAEVRLDVSSDESDIQNLIRGLTDTMNLLRQIRDAGVVTQDKFQVAIKKTVEETTKLIGGLQLTGKAVAALNVSAAEGFGLEVATAEVDKLNAAVQGTKKEFAGITTEGQKATSSMVSGASKATQQLTDLEKEAKAATDELISGASKVAAGQEKVNASLEEQKKKIIDIINASKSIPTDAKESLTVSVGNIDSAEQLAEIVKQLPDEILRGAEAVKTLRQQFNEAQQLSLNLTDKLGLSSPETQAAIQKAAELKDKIDAVNSAIKSSTQSEIQKTQVLEAEKQKYVELIQAAQSLTVEQKKQLTETVTVVSSLKELEKTSQRITSITQASEDAVKLRSELSIVEESVQQLTSQFGELAPETRAAVGEATQLRNRIEEVETSIKAATLSESQKKQALEEEKIKVVEIISANQQLTSEQKKQVTTLVQSSKSFTEIERATRSVNVEFSRAGTPLKSMRAQLQEATNEAARLRREFGPFSDEAVKATARAAALTEEFGDLRATIDALNPDKKFQAITQVTQSVVGGFTAVQGALALVGNESDDVTKALLRVNGALALSTGLNQFFGGFKDAVKNIRAFIQAAVLSTQTLNTAQATNAVISTEQAAAQGAVAVATTASGRAALTAAGAFRALTAALIANPFTAIAAAIALVAGALLVMADDAQEASEQTSKLVDEMEGLQQSALDLINFRKELAGILREIKTIEAGDDPAKQREAQRKSLQEELQFIEQEKTARIKAINDAVEELVKVQARLQDAEASDLNPFNNATGDDKENEKRLKDLIDSNQKALDTLSQQKAKSQAEDVINQSKTNKQIADQEKEEFEKRKKQLEDFIKQRENLISRLSDESFNAEQTLISSEEQIRGDAEKALTEIRKFETEVRNINNAVVGSAELTLDQEQKFAILRAAVQKKFNDDLAKLAVERAKIKLSLVSDEDIRGLEEFKITLNERIVTLRQAGVSETEIEKFTETQLAQARLKFDFASLDAEETYQKNLISAKQRGSEDEKTFEINRQEELLSLEIAFLEAKLNLISGDTSDTGEKLRADLEAQIQVIREAKSKLREDLKDTGDFNFFDLLFGGLKLDDESKANLQRDLQLIGDSFMQIKDSFFESQQAQLDLQINQNDELISLLDEQIAAVQSALEQEQALKDQGFANDVARRQKELEDLRNQKRKALEEERKLSREKQKLANQQAAVEGIIQAAGLATTAVNVIKDGSSKGGIIGAIAGIAFAATLVGLFLSLKSQFKSAAEAPLEEGGEIKLYDTYRASVDHGLIKGRRHSQKGHRIEGTNITVEGDEYVNNRVTTRKFLDVLTSINDRGDFSGVSEKRAKELTTSIIHDTGIEFSPSVHREIVESKMTLVNNTYTSKLEMGNLERKTDLQTKAIMDFKRQMKPKAEIEYLSDGSQVIRHGSKTRRINR